MMDKFQISFLELNSLSCQEIEDLLSYYIDGEILPALLARFEEHLKICETCQLLVQDTRKIVDTAKSLADQAVPEGVRKNLRQELRKRLNKNLPEKHGHLFLIKQP